MTHPTPLNIDMHGLAAAVEALPDAAIDELPFGAIHVNGEGKVVFYSEAERRLSGWNKDAVARNFFTDMAPCLNRPAFKGRIDAALAAGTLDISFDETMDLPSGARDVERHVRIVSSPSGGYWIFMQTYED